MNPKLLHNLTGHDDFLTSISVSGYYMATLSSKKIVIWDLRSWKNIAKVKIKKGNGLCTAAY